MFIMQIAKLIKAPIKLFRKDVITFVVIRRYDIEVQDRKLHYISVKPSASINVLRNKIWHLLELPDYCDEIIILKSSDEVEIPLTELQKGNDPGHPHFLEVWPPDKQSYTCKAFNNLLTIGTVEVRTPSIMVTDTIYEDKQSCTEKYEAKNAKSTETIALNKLRVPNSQPMNRVNFDYKISEMSCKISSTSFFRVNRRKSRENFINVLLKIQNDLCTLSNKLSNLETKIPV